MSDEEPKRKGRLGRRLNRIRQARNREVGPRQVFFAAAISGGFAAITLYLVFYAFGATHLNWKFLGIAFGIGFLTGAFVGAGSWRSGAGVGILAGLWIFMEIFALSMALVIELIGAVIAALFATLSF
ncbi:MAG: hypothetical protein AAF768_12215 [Pseudomonadota bacterium]